MIELILPLVSLAAQSYIAERDPHQPAAQAQYRLWLRTPGRSCNTWRKVTPQIPKEDMLLTESKREEAGKEPGCKFTFVIKPATPPGDMKFELEGSTGPKEFFEVPAFGRPDVSGIANESGTGIAPAASRGRVKMGGVGIATPKEPGKDQKNLNPGTGL